MTTGEASQGARAGSLPATVLPRPDTPAVTVREGSSPRRSLSATFGGVGIRSALRLNAAAAAVDVVAAALAAPPSTPARTAVAADSGADTAVPFTFTRELAMTVPAVRRARNLLCSLLASMPLVLVDDAGNRTPYPWLHRLDSARTRTAVVTDVVDSLLFHGRAHLWRTAWSDDYRGVRSTEFIAATRVVPVVDQLGRTRYALGSVQYPVAGGNLMTVEGIAGALLTEGASTLTGAVLVESAARRFARLEVPTLALVNEGPDLTDEEVDELLSSWSTARAASATAYLNAAVRLEQFSVNPRDLQLVEARQHVAVEVSRLTGIPARYLSTASGDSLTYATSESERRDLVDAGLSTYMAPLEDRLSLDDVSPAGYAVRFDTSTFLRSDTAGRIAAWEAGVRMGALTPQDVARLEPLYPDPAGNGGGVA